MRVALVSIHTAGALGASPPMGLGYLAAALRQAGHDSLILDTGVRAGWRTRLADFGPELVGVGVLSTGAHRIHSVATLAKSLFDCPVVVGGAHATLLPEDTLSRNPGVDFVIMGEAEGALVRLVQALSGECTLDAVPNLVYRVDGSSSRTAATPPPASLDELPFPAWDLLLPELYGSTPIVASRGCPYRCIYCAVPVLQGRRVRHRSAESIVEEMMMLVTDYGMTCFELSGDAFMCDPAVVEQVCKLIVKRRLPVSWQVPGGRSDRLDAALLRLMRQAGCQAVHVGIESGSDAMLRQMRKGLTAAEHRRAISLIHDAGMKVVGNFVVGCPGETEATAGETVAFLDSAAIDTVFVNLAVAYPRTDLYEWVERSGRFLEDPSSCAATHLPEGRSVRVAFETPQLSAEDRQRLHAAVTSAGQRSQRMAARARVQRIARVNGNPNACTRNSPAAVPGTPEISVVIPTKDRATYLELTLASLAVQELDRSRFEVVVVDDGSKDHTAEVLQAWSEAVPLRVARHAQNGGRSAARNSGVELCRAPIVLFLDDDCICSSQLLLHHLKHQIEEPTVVLGDISRVLQTHISGQAAADQVAGLLKCLGVDDQPVGTLLESARKRARVRTVDPEEVIAAAKDIVRRSTLGRLHVGPTLELLRKAGVAHTMPWVHFVTRNASAPLAAVKEVGAFDERYVGWGAEDVDLGYRLHRWGLPFVYERQAFAVHQEHPISSRQEAERRANVSRFMAKYPELGPVHRDILEGRAQAVVTDLAHELSLGTPARQSAARPRRRPRTRSGESGHGPLLWFARGVGYGHAVRDREILARVERACPDLQVIVATHGAGLGLLSRYDLIDLGPWDQTNSYAKAWRAAELVRKVSPVLVACDEEMEAAFAAHRSGVPVTYITNWLLNPDLHPRCRTLQTADSMIFADFRDGAIVEGAWRVPIEYVGPILAPIPDESERRAIRRGIGLEDGEQLLTLAVGAGTKQDLRFVEWLLGALAGSGLEVSMAVAAGELADVLAPVIAADTEVRLLRDFEAARRCTLASDVVLTRGGHTILWELAYAGIPSVAIPHSRSVNPLNRRYVSRMARTGAVAVVANSGWPDAGQLRAALDYALCEKTWDRARQRSQELPPIESAQVAADIIVSHLGDR